MRSDKSRWSKLLHWLSPLLLLSLGLHGLGMLVPIPEEKEVIEREEELPDPIQVSELPVPLPSAEPEPEVTPEPPPEVVTPPPPEPEPIVQEPIVQEPIIVFPQPLPNDPPEQPPEDPPEQPPEDPPEQPPTTPTSQTRSTTRTTPSEVPQANLEFVGPTGIGFGLEQRPTIGDSTNPIILNYPADDTICFESPPTEPIDVIFAAIIGDLEDPGTGKKSRDVIDGDFWRQTGYGIVDQWIGDVIFGAADVDGAIFNTFSEIENRANRQPPGLGEPEIIYPLRIQVVLPNTPC